MGHVSHNAIVVTSWDLDAVLDARNTAEALGCDTSSVTGAGLNGYLSFLIVPDGSKEGWPESHSGDLRRQAWRSWAAGKTHLEWVEVRYGHDDMAAHVVAHPYRKEPDAEPDAQ